MLRNSPARTRIEIGRIRRSPSDRRTLRSRQLEEARDVIDFLSVYLAYAYALPERIRKYSGLCQDLERPAEHLFEPVHEQVPIYTGYTGTKAIAQPGEVLEILPRSKQVPDAFEGYSIVDILDIRRPDGQLDVISSFTPLRDTDNPFRKKFMVLWDREFDLPEPEEPSTAGNFPPERSGRSRTFWKVRNFCCAPTRKLRRDG